MFESLMEEKREPRRLAQPMLSFALHAGLIALAIGRVAEPTAARPVSGETIVEPWVIHDPDGGGTTGNVKTRSDVPVAAPVPVPGVDVPGPLKMDQPAGRFEPIPGLPVSNPVGDGGRPNLPNQIGQFGVYREGDLSDPPFPVHFAEPVYPPALRAAKVEGVVQVTYVVDSLGGVEPGSITIVSTDHSSMAESVRQALQGARFRPGKVRGTPVRSLVRQTVRFSLMSL